MASLGQIGDQFSDETTEGVRVLQNDFTMTSPDKCEGGVSSYLSDGVRSARNVNCERRPIGVKHGRMLSTGSDGFVSVRYVVNRWNEIWAFVEKWWKCAAHFGKREQVLPQIVAHRYFEPIDEPSGAPNNSLGLGRRDASLPAFVCL